MATRVLAFMAHPDDAEISCCGTLTRLKREAGCKIIMATMTSGDGGTKELRPDEIARIRHGEAKAAAKLLDAEYYAGRSSDLFIMYDKPTIQRAVEIVRRSRPNIVLTHAPADYMPDHEITSRVVRMACFAAGAPNILTRDEDPAQPLDHVPHLYYADPTDAKDLFGNPQDPDFVVDITEVIQFKEKMLACHASQREWLRAHHGMDEYIEVMKRWSAARGKLIGRPYGEGFRQHLGHPHPQNNLIAELLKIDAPTKK